MYAGRGTKVQQAAQTLRLPFGTNHSEEGLAGSVMPRVLARIDGADPALDPFLLGLRTPIEGSSSHCSRSRSGCLRRRSREINF